MMDCIYYNDSHLLNTNVTSENTVTHVSEVKYKVENEQNTVPNLIMIGNKGFVIMETNETSPNIEKSLTNGLLPPYINIGECDIMGTTRYKKNILSELVSVKRANDYIKCFDYEEINNNEIVDIQPRNSVEIKSEMVYAKRV